MNKYKKLLSNTGIFFIANFSSKILSFLLVGLYTNILTTSEYGTIDILNVSVNLAVPIITLSIIEAVFRFSIDESDNRKKIFSCGLLVLVVSNLIFLTTIPLFLQINEFKDNLILFYLLTFSSALSQMSSHFTRGIGNTKIFATNGVFHTAVQIFLNILFLVVFRWGIAGYLASAIVSNFLSAFFLFIAAKLYKYISFSFDKNYLKGMIKYSLPLVPNSVFWWIMQSSARYVILFTLSTSHNGLYNVGNKIPMIISIVANVFFSAWQLSSIEEANSKEKDNFFTTVFSLCSMVLICFSSFVMVILQPLYSIWVGKDFYSSWQCAPFLMIASIFSNFSSFIGTNYVAMKKTNGVFLTTLLGAILNLIFSFVLTPIFGIKGTALASALSFALTWIIRAFDTRKFVKINYNLKNFILPLILVIIQAFVLTLGATHIWLQAIFFAVIIFLYFKELLSLIKKVISGGLSLVKNRKA